MFPSISMLVDFAILPDQAAPITGFVDPPGGLNIGKMVVDTGEAVADELDADFPDGFAVWNEVLGPAYECYVQLGTLDPEGFFGGIGLFNEEITAGYLVTWVSDGQDFGIIVTDFPARVTLRMWNMGVMSQGDMIGFMARNNQLSVYLKYGSGSWQKLGTVRNLILPATGYIGFGNLE